MPARKLSLAGKGNELVLPMAQTVSVPQALPLDEMVKKARLVRRHIVSMTARAGSGHPGGSLSAADILVALYFGVLRHNPEDPLWRERDRLILSKGHAAPALYSVLAEAGYFPVEELSTLRRWGSRLQGHADANLTPGVEMSAGSLGQGLSFGVGAALAGRLDKASYHVYVLLGDGECDEGQIWEAAMAASHFHLDNLTAIVDRNQQQLGGWTSRIMDLEPLPDKWAAFGWRVIEADGHSIPHLLDALHQAQAPSNRPSIIIAHTVKGKGVSFMENNVEFHGRAPTQEELARALQELA